MKRATQRRQLRELGRVAAELRAEGWTLRAIATEFGRNHSEVNRALKAIGYNGPGRARGDRHIERMLDGARALKFVQDGHSVADALMAIGGSRARLYRGIKEARADEFALKCYDVVLIDPMLL